MKTHLSLACLCLTLALTTGLATAQDGPHVIQMNTKVISIPMDTPALREAGLSPDAAAGASNLGTISPEKAAALFAKLEKSPGYALFAVPSLTTQSGQQATTESVREFIYPTKFDPPTFSTGKDAKAAPAAPGQLLSATPAMPLEFQMRPVGVRIELQPTFSSEMKFIHVNIAPEIVTFEGFVNYGSPIKAAVADKEGKLQETVLTENLMQQPVFHTFKVKTSAIVTKDYFLVLGGQPAADGPLPITGQKPDLTKTANPAQKPANAIYFFIQFKDLAP